MADVPDFQPGSITGPQLRQNVMDLLAWLRRVLSLDASHPIDREIDGGLVIRDTRYVMARLRGTAGTGSNPYGWDEVVDDASSFAALSGGRSSTHDGNAYEVNGGVNLGQKIVKLRPSQVGDWRFTDDRWHVPCAGQICFLVTGCNNTPLPGASVTVTGPSSYSASCTTNSAGVCCVTITQAGTYNWGVSATNFAGVIGSVVAKCANNTVSVSLAPPVAGFVCAIAGGCCAYPIPDAITITDANGAHTAMSIGGGGYRVCYDLTTSNGQAIHAYPPNPVQIPNVYYKDTVTGQIQHDISLGCLNSTTVSCNVQTIWTAPDYSGRFPLARPLGDFNGSPNVVGAGGEIIDSPYLAPGGNHGDEMVGITYRMVDKTVIGICPPVGPPFAFAGTTFSGAASAASACLATGVSISCFGGFVVGGDPLRNFPDYIGNPVVVSW